MGKDNIYFHAIYFPSVEFADGRNWTLPHHISTTGMSGFMHFFPYLRGLQNISTTKEENFQRVKTEECLAQLLRRQESQLQFGGIILFPPALKPQMPCSHGRNVYVGR